MAEELKINKGVYTGSQEDTDSIKIAIEKLSTISQEQFEEIKKEKWYNRVFDMVTFSQKGRKRLAEQINTVAQAQQILIELLLRLSSDNTDISSLVALSMNDIRKITEQNIYLLSKINCLENIALGIKSDMDIDKLTDKDKQVLCACLYWLSDNSESASDEQKIFANAVINYLGTDIQMNNPVTAFKNMENDSKRKILACCMEYIFLAEGSFASFDEYSEFIEEFDFGGKTIRELKQQIESLYSLRGFEGFYSKYMVNNYMEIEDMFFFEFDDVMVEDTNQEFDESALAALQGIMEKHGIVKDDADYRELTKEFFAITPDAYLGKVPNHDIYFTTAAIYANSSFSSLIECSDDIEVTLALLEIRRSNLGLEKYEEWEQQETDWTVMCYDEINLEQVTFEKYFANIFLLNIPGEDEKKFIFSGEKKICDGFVALMHELKCAITSECDEYVPIRYDETYFYGEILIDFLKLGNHNVMAALKKCSEITCIEENGEEDLPMFKAICEYGLSEQKVTVESLKAKILEWKHSHKSDTVDVYMAVLLKDLVEVLQLATGKPNLISSVENTVFEWISEEAQIDDVDNFMDMIRLPYCLISKHGANHISVSEIVRIVDNYTSYQKHIPFQILDDDKNGLWSLLHELSDGILDSEKSFIKKTKNNVDGLYDQVMWLAYFDFCISTFGFIVKTIDFDELVSKEEVRSLWKRGGLLEQFENIDIYRFLQNEDWKNMWIMSCQEDRRAVGKEILDRLYMPAKYERMSEEQFLIKAKELGFKKIVDYRVVNKEGIKGWLIWDYKVWNEICFVDFRHLKSESLFKGMNDGKTKEKFEKLLRKYAMR